jgi:hypothetical protein
LAGLVTHLFEVEPANFILNRLLSSGVLHEHLRKCQEKVVKGERRTHLTVKLAAVLGWFLYRRRLPSTWAKSQPRKKWLPSEECPALPELPERILKEVQSYNASVFDLFQQLSWSVTSCKKFGEQDFTLPFSKRHFPETWDQRGQPFEKDSAFQKIYIDQLVKKLRARCPLAAISGHGDFFKSPTDLVNTLRNVIQMDLNALPIVPPAHGEDGARGALEATNSWVLDFMTHGKMKYLAEDNGIDSTKAYKLISSFKEKTAMACAALKAYAPADDIVLTTFQQLTAELDARLTGDKTK